MQETTTLPKPLPNFASDNWAPAHPDVMDAVVRANNGPVPSYGGDPYTQEAEALIRREFGATAQPFFVFTGTGANVLSIESCIRPYEAILCSDTAHIQTSEWGAVERMTGSRIIPIHAPDGKITADRCRCGDSAAGRTCGSEAGRRVTDTGHGVRNYLQTGGSERDFSRRS